MTLGDRCDEIVRLIDETLGGLTTPVPPRRRRLAVEPAVAAVPGAFDPDTGPTAA